MPWNGKEVKVSTRDIPLAKPGIVSTLSLLEFSEMSKADDGWYDVKLW
jgi:hypothetical protein